MFGNRASQRGFTLLETMIAGGLLVAGVMGLIGMQLTTINGSRFGNRLAQAMMFAEEAAATVQGTPWDTLMTYATAVDAGQPDGFRAIDPANVDPSGASPALVVEGLTDAGAPAAFNAGNAMFQRIVQVRQEDVTVLYPGPDAMRIKVTVRFRDSERTTRWREASIVVLRPKII